MSTPITINDDIITKFDEIERVLDATYGPRLLRKSGDPVSELVGTILSQNTSDVNTARSMARLREEFPTWDEVRAAPVDDVIDAIRSGGLANRKASRIQAVLETIDERTGDADLGFLADMDLEEAKAWLTSMNGIGHKTAACVLLFSLGRPAMPVDTHVHRVMRRLGVVPPRTSPEGTAHVLEALIGPDPHRTYAVHVETISHGRRVCKAQRPKCDTCPLLRLCDYGQSIATDIVHACQ